MLFLNLGTDLLLSKYLEKSESVKTLDFISCTDKLVCEYLAKSGRGIPTRVMVNGTQRHGFMTTVYKTPTHTSSRHLSNPSEGTSNEEILHKLKTDPLNITLLQKIKGEDLLDLTNNQLARIFNQHSTDTNNKTVLKNDPKWFYKTENWEFIEGFLPKLLNQDVYNPLYNKGYLKITNFDLTHFIKRVIQRYALDKSEMIANTLKSPLFVKKGRHQHTSNTGTDSYNFSNLTHTVSIIDNNDGTGILKTFFWHDPALQKAIKRGNRGTKHPYGGRVSNYVEWNTEWEREHLETIPPNATIEQKHSIMLRNSKKDPAAWEMSDQDMGTYNPSTFRGSSTQYRSLYDIESAVKRGFNLEEHKNSPQLPQKVREFNERYFNRYTNVGSSEFDPANYDIKLKDLPKLKKYNVPKGDTDQEPLNDFQFLYVDDPSKFPKLAESQLKGTHNILENPIIDENFMK